ncbi:hypothetical protein DPMN_082772 [Dreissena polymorpha]|uniref:Uncharacterized protein n=1 Tax=Dreissena polymorpha TaxID=45954 RepID=A0A9D3Y854_DREPO|nr:hypothetical protein DPMN_082772 [Dreissena polymorpha]
MYSRDNSCILSTLDFVCNLATKHNVHTIVTFIKPLYWKAAENIIDALQSSCLKNIVLALGVPYTYANAEGHMITS